MPAYVNDQFVGSKPNNILLQAGIPAYLIGGRDDGSAPTIMQVTSVAQSTTTITLGVTVTAGKIPAVGNLISVQGTAVDAGNANVVAVALGTVTITASTGKGSVTYTVVPSTTFAQTSDGGVAVVSVPESTETISAVYSSLPAVMQFNDPNTRNDRVITLMVTLGSGFSAFTANLQTALNDVDSEYVNVNGSSDFSGATSGPYLKQYATQASRFYRLRISAVTGSGTVVAKMLV